MFSSANNLVITAVSTGLMILGTAFGHVGMAQSQGQDDDSASSEAEIRDYLAQFLSDQSSRRDYRSLLDQLGSSSFREREAASAQLSDRESVYYDLLREACRSQDPEIRFRSLRLKKAIDEQGELDGRHQQLDDALLAIRQDRIQGFGELLLPIVDYCDSTLLESQAARAFVSSVRLDDVRWIQELSSHESELVRRTAVHALIELKHERLHDQLDSFLTDVADDVRIEACLGLANLGARHSLQPLCELLDSDEPRIRNRAVSILRQLTSQDFEYQAFADSDARKQSISRWSDWIDLESADASLTYPITMLEPNAEGLVLHLTFDDRSNSGADSSGHDHHAELHEAQFVEEGPYRSACHIDGTGSHLTVPNSELLSFDRELTIAVWVCLHSFGPDGYGNEEGHIVKRGDPLWWNPTFGIGIRKQSGRAKFVIGNPERPGPHEGADLFSESVLELRTWHLLVGTYDGEKARLFVDGVLETEQAYDGRFRENESPIMIGGGMLGNANEFANHFGIDGIIDEIRIYRRALEPAEVELLYGQ